MATVDGERRSVGAAVMAESAPAQRPHRGPGAASAQSSSAVAAARRGMGAALIVPFAAPLLLVAVLLAAMLVVLRQTDAIDGADRVLIALHRLHASLLDAERGARTFAIAPTEAHLASYRQAVAALDAQFPALAALLADDPEQLRRSQGLRQRYDDWQRQAERDIAERRMAAGAPRPAAAAGEEQMDGLRAGVDELIGVEQGRRRERQAWADAATRGMLAVAVAAALLLGLGLAYSARRRLVAFADRYERARAESRVADTELRAAFELGAAATAHVDPITHRFLRVNPAFAALTGYSEPELLAMRVVDVTHPDDRDADLRTVQGLSVGEPAHYEKRVLRKDGTVRWVDVEAGLVAPAPGQPARVITSISDVTARKRADTALRDSESRFRRLLERLPALVWTARASGECDYLSPQWLAYTGRPEAEQLGDGWLDSVHPHDRERLAAQWRQTLRDGGELTAEYRLRRHDERYRWFELRAAVLAEAGRPPTWLVSSHDVDAHKHGMDDARARADALERQIDERTAERDEAGRELDAFTYSVAHDLRSPLRRVDGFAELLGKAVADGRADKVQHYAGRITAEAERAGQLIDDLLAFARVGRTALRVQPVDAGAVVADVRAELDPGSGRAIVWDVEALPAVGADPAMLRIVFANLLSNAVKFTGPRPEAHVRVGSRRGDGETIFFVADDGVGFDMRFAGQLFSVFQRLHLAEEFEGSGIGLAMVHRIVSRHGGRTWADAAEGRGATFYFSLPDRAASAHA